MLHQSRRIPAITYLVKMVCKDHNERDYNAHLYVGHDKPLSLAQISEVVDLWLLDGMDKRAKKVLSFSVLDTITL